MSEPVGVGMIGLGMAGSGHLVAFAKSRRVRVVGAADPDPAACARAAKAVPGLTCTGDYRELLRRRDVDLVVVATPHKLHRVPVLDALRAGKHVFCEKPLAVNAAECDEMIAAARAAGRWLLVYQTQRFGPQFYALKQISERGGLGRRLFGAIHYLGNELERIHDVTSWKCSLDLAGGGVLLDGGVHVVDLANWYFGRPVSVMAQVRTPSPWPQNKGEPTGQLLITYEDGTVAQVLATFEAQLKNQGGLKIAAFLFFEKGNAYAEYAHLGGLESRRLLTRVDPTGKESVSEPGADEGVNYIDHVLDCLAGKTQPLVTAEEARMAVAVVEAAYESARTGRQVEVPPLK